MRKENRLNDTFIVGGIFISQIGDFSFRVFWGKIGKKKQSASPVSLFATVNKRNYECLLKNYLDFT